MSSLQVQEQLQNHLDDITYKRECELKDHIYKENIIISDIEALIKDKTRMDQLLTIKDQELDKLKSIESKNIMEIENLKYNFEKEKYELKNEIREKYTSKIKNLKIDIDMFKDLIKNIYINNEQ